jgi:CelD/BcsL family acetyltransferase involved in cellulose biosynthesis
LGVAEQLATGHAGDSTAAQRWGEVIASAPETHAPGEHGSLSLRPAELTTEIVTTVAGIQALKPDYERIHRLTGNTLPFALQEWHLSWCSHFLNSSPQVHDEPRFCVLRNRSGDCSAIVPLILTRWRVGPLRLATADFLGADPGLTEIRSPLIEPGCERLAVRAVHDSFARVPDWDWIQWRGIDRPLAEALALESAPRWHASLEDYVLDLPPSWQEFRAGLRRNVRESLRHCYNSLKRDGHVFEFIVAREPAEVRRALERFLQLHGMRAEMPSGVKHPNRFASGPLREFLYDVGARLAARDAARVFQLKIGAQIVAARIGFIVADSLYLYYSGFDPAWARYSVMTTTVAEALRYAIASGLRTVNLSLTAEQSKLRWQPRRVELRTALVPRATLRSRIACGAYRLAVSSNGVAAWRLKNLLLPQRNWK